MQITKEMLIADWEEIEAQLREMEPLRQRKAALEAYGLAAFGWKPGDEANKPIEHGIFRFQRITKTEAPANGIDYTASAREWYESLVEETAKTTDFVEWLKAKYPGVEINRNSIAAPIRTLVNERKLEVFIPGEGRRPTEYTVPKNFTRHEADGV